MKALVVVILLLAVLTTLIVLTNRSMVAEMEVFYAQFEPVTIPITGYAMNTYGEITVILVKDGNGAIPVNPRRYVPHWLKSDQYRGVFVICYDALPGGEYVIIRKPNAKEAPWTVTQKSPRFSDTVRWTYEVHVTKGHNPEVNSANHGKFGEW